MDMVLKGLVSMFAKEATPMEQIPEVKVIKTCEMERISDRST